MFFAMRIYPVEFLPSHNLFFGLVTSVSNMKPGMNKRGQSHLISTIEYHPVEYRVLLIS